MLLLWSRLMLLLLWWGLALLLWSRLRLLLLWWGLALLLWGWLTLLLLGCRWTLLWFCLTLRGHLALLWCLRLVLLRCGLPLWFHRALLWHRRTLLWHWLPLLRLSLTLRSGLVLLLRSHLVIWNRLVLLRSLAGGLLCRSGSNRRDSARLIPVRLILIGLVPVHVRLVLIRLIADWLSPVCRLRWSRMRLRRGALLRLGLITSLHGRRRPDVAICHERLADGQTGRSAMVYVGKLSAISAGNVFILELLTHGRGMSLVTSRQFRRSGSHLEPARSAVEAHTGTTPVFVDGAIVDVVYHRDVDVVDRAVVVEVTAAPVAALVADTDVSIAIVDAAIEADVRTPVSTVEAVTVIVIAPVAGCPERALIGSLDPYAGYPVVARLRISPVAGGPEIIVAGSLRLIVLRQGRRGLIGVGHGLRAIAGIIRALVIGAAGVRRSALLGGIDGGHNSA